MRHRISDHDIELLLVGSDPMGQPELSGVAGAIAEFRGAAHETVAQPSAALLARLDLPVSVVVSGSSAPAAGPLQHSSASAEGTVEQPHTRGYKKMFEWIAGLGLAAKLAAGSGVLALGLTGVGAAGALPGPVQTAFDSAVETVLPLAEEDTTGEDGIVEDDTLIDDTVTDEETTESDDLPVGGEEFGRWVSERAQDPDKDGEEFGRMVSEQAQELGVENGAVNGEERAAERRAERPSAPATPEDDASQGDDDSEDAEVEETAPAAGESEGGKPSTVPSGRP